MEVLRVCAVDDCSKPPRTGAAELCHMHYYRVRRTGSTGAGAPLWIPDPVARLWSNVDRRGPGECWPWTGHTYSAGYGRLRVNGRAVGAHRFALELHLGRPLTGWALHGCDNPPCCNTNPGHVYEGDHAQNVADKVERDRQARGPEHAARIREGWARNGYLRRSW